MQPMAVVRLAHTATSKVMENVLETIMKPMTAALPIIQMDPVLNAVLGSFMPTHFATAILSKAALKPKVAHVSHVELGLP